LRQILDVVIIFLSFDISLLGCSWYFDHLLVLPFC
jgi:hypothetical protein